MKVEVTAKHIAKGDRNLAESCPVALALKDLGASWVVADTDHVNFCLNGQRMSCGFPEDVEHWIEDFDTGCEVEPITFDLPIEEHHVIA